MISSTVSGVMGPTYVRFAVPGSVMIVAGLEFKRITSYPSALMVRGGRLRRGKERWERAREMRNLATRSSLEKAAAASDGEKVDAGRRHRLARRSGG
jgi:hypothetical protein